MLEGNGCMNTGSTPAGMEAGPFYLNPAGLWRWLSREFKLAFISALIFGFLTHLYAFTNLLINHDGLHGLNTVNESLTSGRWASKFFSSFSWTYEMPVVIGLLAILGLAFCVGLTVRILEIDSLVCIFLTAGFMTTFPVIAATFSYLYISDAFFIAALFCVAAVYLAKRYRYGGLASVLCIALSLGIYQAYIGCAVSLFLLDCILTLFSSTPVRDIVKRGLRYIAIILAGLVLYRIILSFLLWKNETALTDYKGMSAAASAGVMDYLRTLPATCEQLFSFLWTPSYLVEKLILAQRIMFLLVVGCLLLLTVLKRLHKDPVRLLLLACGAVLLPIALNLVNVICAGQTTPNLLMQYSYVYTFAFALKIFEMTAQEVLPAKWPRRFSRVRHGAALAGLALCAALVWANVCFSNMTYLALERTIVACQSIGVRVLDRLESLEGYVPGKTPVYLVSGVPSIQYSGIKFPLLTDLPPYTCDFLGMYAGPSFLYRICGGTSGGLCNATAEQRRKIQSSGVLDSIPSFPTQGSVAMIDGVAVVKFS